MSITVRPLGGGTWYALTTTGNPATGQAASSPSPSGGGY